MNVDAHAEDAVTSGAVRIGELHAVPAAVSVHHVLAQSQRLFEQMHEALTSRAIIDQARGGSAAGPEPARRRRWRACGR